MEDYRVSYAGTRFVESLAYVQSFPKTLPPLRDELHGIEIPTLIIYGEHDRAVLPGNADRLGRALRHRQTIALNCGHFAWEEEADAYAVGIARVDWWRLSRYVIAYSLKNAEESRRYV